MGEVKVESKQLKTNALMEKAFGIEGTLAAKNMKRSKRNFRASVISLTIGIVLFINLGFLSGQLNDLVDIMFSYSSADVIADYNSSYDYVVSETTGKEELIIHAPIASETTEVVTAKLREYRDTTVFGSGNDIFTYTANVPKELISPEMMEAAFNAETLLTYEIPVEIIIVDNQNYTLLCQRAGVPFGSNILINHYIHNDNGNATTIVPFHLDGQNLQLIKTDGSTHEIAVHGELVSEDIPIELLYPNTRMIRLLVPVGEVRSFGWMLNTSDALGVIEYANTILSEMFPEPQDGSYMELGFTTRVYQMQDYMKVMNIAIILTMMFVYSFVILLALIGLTNIISTMSTNVQMRSREFAVLQSIGMTHDGLKRMLNLESIMCSTKSLIIGLPLALVLTYLINKPIRSMFPVPYQFPCFTVVCCIVVIFVITWSTMWYSSKQLYKKNVIETIRLEN